jgi:hypothetical protein
MSIDLEDEHNFVLQMVVMLEFIIRDIEVRLAPQVWILFATPLSSKLSWCVYPNRMIN